MIVSLNITTNKIIEGETTLFETKKKYYFVDLLKMKPYLISEFYNDLSGERQEPIFFQNQTSNLKYISYEAVSYLRIITALNKDSKMKVLNRDKFIKLGDGMTEDANPILLSGKFSK
jgi:hypothetical protein